MKKNRVIVLVLLLTGFQMQAQQINFEPSLEKAQAAARQQQKPLAVLITIEPPVPTPNFLNGLKDKTVVEKFNSLFINYKIAKEDTAVTGKIIRQYKITRFPSFIFVDAKGGLLFSEVAFLSRPQPILELADKAIAASKEPSLADYDSTYNSEHYNTAFLKTYISKRQKAGITDNAALIEKYVSGLTIADLDNYQEVLFILKAGPLADGKVYKLAHINKNISDSIFKTEPLADRIAMNNCTIDNTIRSAIANKDLNRAYAAANFTRGSWQSDQVTGQKNWQLKMLQYYKGVQDTVNYLQQAGNYYDQYYMRISVDSIRKKDSLNYEAAKKKAQQNAVTTRINDSTTQKKFVFSYPKNNATAAELNNAAWIFYQMAGNNELYLLKAMLWSKRSIELEPLPAYYDTYAHLLYKLQFYDEAEAMQKKATEMAKTSRSNFKNLQEEYEKIKQRKL